MQIYEFLCNFAKNLTRLNKPHKYGIDIDVIDENDRVIQGGMMEI